MAGCCGKEGGMSAGTMRYVISLQSRSESRDQFGAFTKSWSTYSSNVRAGVLPISMRERQSGDQTIAEIDKRFFIRYSSSVQPTDRLVFRSDRDWETLRLGRWNCK